MLPTADDGPFFNEFTFLEPCQHIFCVQWCAPTVLIWKIKMHGIIICAVTTNFVAEEKIRIYHVCMNNNFVWLSGSHLIKLHSSNYFWLCVNAHRNSTTELSCRMLIFCKNRYSLVNNATKIIVLSKDNVDCRQKTGLIPWNPLHANWPPRPSLFATSNNSVSALV